MRQILRVFWMSAVVAGLAIFPVTARGEGADDPDPTRIKTVDGLNLWAKWYVGGKNQNSDTVILVHGYGSDPTKSGWEPLAKNLQKEGYSVLLFDLRGHGRSADFKVFDDKDAFTNFKFFPYNRLSGATKTSKDLKKESFSPKYYPYLVNDLSAVRRFVDSKHDIPENNSNRIFIITEKDSCPLVMFWIATEFARQGDGASVPGAIPQKHVAGKDIAGVVFLSWGTPSQSPTGQASAISLYSQVASEKVMLADTDIIRDQVRSKVAMAYVFGKEDRASAGEASKWFTQQFRIAPGKKDDPENVKYMVDIQGAEKLSGNKLFELVEEEKDAAGNVKKVSVVESRLLSFLRATKKKGINGSDYLQKHFATNLDFVPVPIENGRWSPPK
jgi:hypothetical protein